MSWTPIEYRPSQALLSMIFYIWCTDWIDEWKFLFRSTSCTIILEVLTLSTDQGWTWINSKEDLNQPEEVSEQDPPWSLLRQTLHSRDSPTTERGPYAGHRPKLDLGQFQGRLNPIGRGVRAGPTIKYASVDYAQHEKCLKYMIK